VGTIDVVVVDELGEAGVEVSLVDDDDMVQALPANRAHYALGDGVCARVKGGKTRSEFNQPGRRRGQGRQAPLVW
jgi:hypothetical protein